MHVICFPSALVLPVGRRPDMNVRDPDRGGQNLQEGIILLPF